MSFHASGASGKYFLMGSSSPTLPSSTSIITAVAVNCFPTTPIEKWCPALPRHSIPHLPGRSPWPSSSVRRGKRPAPRPECAVSAVRLEQTHPPSHQRHPSPANGLPTQVRPLPKRKPPTSVSFSRNPPSIERP